jgi:hypothetical protein
VKSVRSRKVQTRKTRKATAADRRRRNEHAVGRPVSGALLDETIAIWQPRASRTLTREDARQIVENMTGFFNVLREWDLAERATKQASPHKRCPENGGPSNESVPDEATSA